MKVSRIAVQLAGEGMPVFVISDRCNGSLDLVITPNSDGWTMLLTPEEKIEMDLATQERRAV